MEITVESTGRLIKFVNVMIYLFSYTLLYICLLLLAAHGGSEVVGVALTLGQLGDVMKESAQAGISFIRSVAEQYEIPKEFFEKHDIHIHIPEGAVPKDGPSAGITMATAMVSAITKVPVKADVAMTGEITLRGRVLPIGGLKEKLLAAKKAGIHMVLVPEKNEPDVRELDAEITDGLQIEFVGSMEQVLKLALVEKK